MNLRIPIILFTLSSVLTADEKPKWSPLKDADESRNKINVGIFKEWRELSHAALEADNKTSKEFKVERCFNKNANESSSSIDCGVVCDLPKIGLKVEAEIHYFFEGTTVPDDIADSVTITFNIKGKGNGYYLIGSMEPEFHTKKGNLFRPGVKGIGSIDETKWSYSLLAIMDEANCRRLVSEEIKKSDLGVLTITRPDVLQQCLKLLLEDLKARREATATMKP